MAPQKTVRWHIDYLTMHASVRRLGAVTLADAAGSECGLVRQVAERFQAVADIPGFGASDCREDCAAHLCRAAQRVRLPELLALGQAAALIRRVPQQ